MTTAREQAREAAKKARKNYHLPEERELIAADAASDVWEPIVKEIHRIQQDWWEAAVPMNVALSEIRQVVQKALGE